MVWLDVLLYIVSSKTILKFVSRKDIQHDRGLWRGNPPSPHLFFFIIDPTQNLIDHQEGFISKFRGKVVCLHLSLSRMTRVKPFQISWKFSNVSQYYIRTLQRAWWQPSNANGYTSRLSYIASTLHMSPLGHPITTASRKTLIRSSLIHELQSSLRKVDTRRIHAKICHLKVWDGP